MVVKFTKNRKHNFDKNNIIEILNYIQDPDIQNLVSHPKDFILVVGSIHKSQFTADNPQGFHWIKIQGYRNNTLVHRLSAVHIYLCFHSFDTYGNYMGCKIPPNYTGTDIANVDNIYGRWDVVGLSY